MVNNFSDIGNPFTITSAGVLVSGVVEGAEQTSPAAPAANGYKIFAVDNGSGKTVLKVQFATGAAQVLATAFSPADAAASVTQDVPRIHRISPEKTAPRWPTPRKTLAACPRCRG